MDSPFYDAGWLFGSSLYDNREILCFQRCTADKAAVHMLFAQQLFCVFRVHGAAVLDRHCFGNIFAVKARYHTANKAVDFVGLISGSGFAGADRPYRFLIYDFAGQLLFGNAAQRHFCLHGTNFLSDALLPLL